jgi:hypothetical protein
MCKSKLGCVIYAGRCGKASGRREVHVYLTLGASVIRCKGWQDISKRDIAGSTQPKPWLGRKEQRPLRSVRLQLANDGHH